MTDRPAIASIPDQFERDTNGTVADWLRWLPGACGTHRLTWLPDNRARVEVGLQGQLELGWEVLPARRIALVCLPRLRVSYRFVGVSAEARRDFMRHFDLYMQRGGG